MRRYPFLDATRALAAALVLLSHVGFWTGADAIDFSGGVLARGDIGVAVFFAISAFLLLRPFIAAGLAGAPGPDLRLYARRRAARILPAYWVCLCAVLVVAATMTVPGTTPGGLGSLGTVLSHVFLVQAYADQSYQGFSQTWSLTCEVIFYLLVPWIGRGLGRVARHRPARVGWLLGAAAVIGIAAQGVVARWTELSPHTHAGILGTSVIGHASWFAAGAWVALAVTTSRGSRLRDLARSSPGTLLGLALLIFVVISGPLGGPRDLTAPTVLQAMCKEAAYAGCALLVVLAATAPARGAIGTALATSPLTRWLGDISYGVFLWHVLVLQVLYAATGRALFTGGFASVLLSVTAVSMMLAAASWSVLEQPVLRWAHCAPQGAHPAPQPQRPH